MTNQNAKVSTPQVNLLSVDVFTVQDNLFPDLVHLKDVILVMTNEVSEVHPEPGPQYPVSICDLLAVTVGLDGVQLAV